MTADTALDTPRLILRSWRDADRAPMHEHVNSRPDVMRWVLGPQDRAHTDRMIDTFNERERAHGCCFWAVERKEDGALLGFCGIQPANRPACPDIGTPEIGWRFRADSWGQGYAKEAAAASLSWAFDTLGSDFVSAWTLPGNEPSWGLMRRLGMARREDLDFYDPDYGPEIGTEIVYRITREEWADKRKEFES